MRSVTLAAGLLAALAACTSAPPAARPGPSLPPTAPEPAGTTTQVPSTTATPLTACAASVSCPLRQKLAQLLFATVTTSSTTQVEKVLRAPSPVG